MITSIHITRLRGIREGKLEDLAPLTVLVGPNGCGKSTVLDAIHIGAGNLPLDAVGQAVTRRSGLRYGAPWLLWRRGAEGPAFLVAVTDSGHARASQLTITEGQGTKPSWAYNERRYASPTEASVRRSWVTNQKWRAGSGPAHQSKTDRVAFPVDGPYGCGRAPDALEGAGEVRLVEPASASGAAQLHELYSAAVTAGRRGDVTELVVRVVPGLDHLEILTEGDKPIVHMVYGTHSVPVALAGDGIVALVRAALELATVRQGAVLLEEPEAHQHPGAMVRTAQAIHAAVASGVQVIVSTHSLDVIDMLLSQAPERFDLDNLAVFRMACFDGALGTQRLVGKDVKFDRERIGEDLR